MIQGVDLSGYKSFLVESEPIGCHVTHQQCPLASARQQHGVDACVTWTRALTRSWHGARSRIMLMVLGRMKYHGQLEVWTESYERIRIHSRLSIALMNTCHSHNLSLNPRWKFTSSEKPKYRGLHCSNDNVVLDTHCSCRCTELCKAFSRPSTDQKGGHALLKLFLAINDSLPQHYLIASVCHWIRTEIFSSRSCHKPFLVINIQFSSIHRGGFNETLQRWFPIHNLSCIYRRDFNETLQRFENSLFGGFRKPINVAVTLW